MESQNNISGEKSILKVVTKKDIMQLFSYISLLLYFISDFRTALVPNNIEVALLLLGVIYFFFSSLFTAMDTRSVITIVKANYILRNKMLLLQVGSMTTIGVLLVLNKELERGSYFGLDVPYIILILIYIMVFTFISIIYVTKIIAYQEVLKKV